MPAKALEQSGLGSISLILLHHLLFHLDLRPDGTSYVRKIADQHQIRASSS